MTGFYVIGTSVIADQSSFHTMFPFHSPENICEQENCHVSVTMMLKFSTCQTGTAANNNFKSSQRRIETELHSENALEQTALTIGVGTSQMLTQIAISLFYVGKILPTQNVFSTLAKS